MDPGNAAEWANVGVTCAALIAAGWAAWSTHKALSIERSRDKAREMAEIASQAALIAAWGVEDQRGFCNWSFTVANNSAVPVYGVAVRFHSDHRPGEEPVARVGVLPPGTRSVRFPSEWIEYEENNRGERVVSGWLAGDIGVSVMFTDSTGCGWERDQHGALRMVYGHDAQWFTGETVWPGSTAGR